MISKEQLLYAQLGVVESLMWYLRDNIGNSEFCDFDIATNISDSLSKIIQAQVRMKDILKELDDNR